MLDVLHASVYVPCLIDCPYDIYACYVNTSPTVPAYMKEPAHSLALGPGPEFVAGGDESDGFQYGALPLGSHPVRGACASSIDDGIN